MKKNPLVLLLALSGTFFLLFLAFVWLAMGSFVREGAKTALLQRTGNQVGVLELKGVILESKKFLKNVERFEESSEIKGVILRINSPGGAVAPSEEMHAAVMRLKKSKPVIASFESVAASGGYYVAVAADKIVTNAGTMTGSIGVIMDFANMGELYKWAKVERYNVKSGKYKDIGNDTRPMSADEKGIMQDMIMNVYGQFVRAVANGRKLPLDKVTEMADGRIYTGEQAVSLGLADKIGGIDVAIEEMKAAAKLTGKVNLVYPEQRKRSFLEMLGGPQPEGGLFKGLVRQVLTAVQEQITEVRALNGKLPMFL
ncbi:MAG: signal peptide peptidase SppA [Bdellovibrionales bacterium]|nr:signal peptide peptidase SppA [Bdellovibrionales bacterium]